MLPRHMTEQEAPDSRHASAIALPSSPPTRLRVSETVAIKVDDIKSDRKCLHVPSGGAERMAPLPDGVIDYLRGYWKNIWPASWLFYGASPDEPVAVLHRAFKAARDKDRSPPQLPQLPSLDGDPSSGAGRGYGGDPGRAIEAPIPPVAMPAPPAGCSRLHPLSGFPVLRR